MTTVFGGGSSIPLFRIAGFRIGVHPSWFLVLFLWIAVLQDSFASVLGSDSQGFTAAVLAAFLFFGSIVLHELGHAFAARREGIGVAGIDLFFFGGFMKATRDSEPPGEEVCVAAAAPARPAARGRGGSDVERAGEGRRGHAAGRRERQHARGARQLHGLDERDPA